MKALKNIFKLTPVVLLAFLLIKFEMDMLIAGPLAAFYAAFVAYLTVGLKPTEAIDVAVDNVKEIQLVFFILMMAAAMANVFMETGVGAAIVNLALNAGMTARTIAPIGLMVTGILSVATGTSWGTFAACAPIFLWLNHIVEGNLLYTTAAIAGGACFGDNIGLISDTTVVSSGIQGVEIIHRIRHQGVWSVGCLVIAAIIFFVMSASLPNHAATGADAYAQITPEAFAYLEENRPGAITLLDQIRDGVPAYMGLPLVIVVVVAIMGVPTLFCLAIGIVSALILGSFAGTIGSLDHFLNGMVMGGFEDAGSWVIVMMMWISGFGGIMNRMEAFEPLSRFVLMISKSVRQLMFWNGVLSLAGNALLADEMAQIVTVGPIIRELVDENIEGSEEDMYTLHLRNATFSDALGVFGSQLIPWHVYIAYYVGIAAAVYPLHEFVGMDIIRYNVMAFVAVGSLLILTLTGLDRFIPLFHMPAEPKVQLRKEPKVKEA
ncbi:MAG: Na+/H+ antiporter NhaC family protein [Tissierellia bacterium]|nr:Na+/H+ antiporter NhaC family protein [Tissierellia bacterium]